MIYSVDQVGICDFDSYAILWYGNYWKYYKRTLLKHFDSYEMIKMFQMLYLSPVQWKNRGNISLKIIEKQEQTYTVVLLWYVDNDIYNAMYCQIRSDKNVNVITLNDSEMKVFRKLKMPFRLSKSIATFSQNATVYEDCVNGSYLSEHTCLNLFEQMRTDSFGGQTNLSNLSEEYGYTIVVAKMHNLKFYPEPVSVGQTITCHMILTRQISNMCFEFHQTIETFDNQIIGEAVIMLCIFDPEKKQLVNLPDQFLELFSSTIKWI